MFPVDIQVLKQMIHTDECSFKSALACNCSTCTLKPATENQIENANDLNYYEQTSTGNFAHSRAINKSTTVRNGKRKPKKLSFEHNNSVNCNFIFFTLLSSLLFIL